MRIFWHYFSAIRTLSFHLSFIPRYRMDYVENMSEIFDPIDKCQVCLDLNSFQGTDCRRHAVCPISRCRVRCAARFCASREISEGTWSFCILVWATVASPAYTRGIDVWLRRRRRRWRRTGPTTLACRLWPRAFVPLPGWTRTSPRDPPKPRTFP